MPHSLTHGAWRLVFRSHRARDEISRNIGGSFPLFSRTQRPFLDGSGSPAGLFVQPPPPLALLRCDWHMTLPITVEGLRCGDFLRVYVMKWWPQQGQ